MRKEKNSYDRVFRGFEELVRLPQKRTIPVRIAQAGVATVAGLMICTGFGLMVMAKPTRDERKR